MSFESSVLGRICSPAHCALSGVGAFDFSGFSFVFSGDKPGTADSPGNSVSEILAAESLGGGNSILAAEI